MSLKDRERDVITGTLGPSQSLKDTSPGSQSQGIQFKGYVGMTFEGYGVHFLQRVYSFFFGMDAF